MNEIRKTEQQLDIPMKLRMDIQECEKYPLKKQTIAIDFDGVLHRYSKGWNGGKIYDKPVDGAVEAYYDLIKHYNVVIFTAREDTKAVKEWLDTNFDFEKHGLDCPDVTNKKPIAVAYIDDRGIKFTDWTSTLNELKVLDKDPEATAKKITFYKQIKTVLEWIFILNAFFGFAYIGWVLRGFV